MINQARIKNIEEALKENNIDSFSDQSLIKILSMLTIDELDYFINKSNDIFGTDAMKRLERLEPLIRFEISKNMHDIEYSEMYENFLNSIKNNKINKYILTLSREQLGDLKKILSFKNAKVQDNGVNEIIKFIKSQIIKNDGINTSSINR